MIQSLYCEHAILHCSSSVSSWIIIFVFCCFSSFIFIWFYFSTPYTSLLPCHIQSTVYIPCIRIQRALHSICFWDLLKYSFYTFWMRALNEYSVLSFFFFIFAFFCINTLHCHRIIMLRMLPFHYSPCTWFGCYFHVIFNKNNTHTNTNQ